MRALVFGGLIAIGALLLFVFVKPQPADVYAMPMANVYDKLVHVDFGQPVEGETALHTKKGVHGNGTNEVVWSQSGDMAAFSCLIELAPLADDANKTHLTVTCDGGAAGAGAAAGMLHNMMRNEYIERIDATLHDRPYDKRRALGATAARWPGDGVDGSYGTMVGTALKMDADERRMEHEMKKAENSNSNSVPVGDEHDSGSSGGERDGGSGMSQ